MRKETPVDPNEISQSLHQIYQAFMHVNELNYQIQFAKHMLRLKSEKLEHASEVLAERQASRQELATIARELESKTSLVSEGLQRRRRQLDGAKSPREYDSLKLQIELDEANSDRLTDETLIALSRLEESEAALEEAQKVWQDCRNAWETASKDCQSIETDALQKIQKALEVSKNLSKELPRDHANIIARFLKAGNDLIVKAGDEPIAPIIDDVYCGSCHEGLPPDVVLKVKEGMALCCFSCGKLLFIPNGDVS